MAKKAKNSEKKSALDNLTPFPKGVSGNPDGRPLGQRNYLTIQKEAIKRVAEANGKTPHEVEELIQAKAVEAALKGDFQFYKDIKDRTHGKAQQLLDVTSGGEPLQVVFDEAFNKE